MNDKEEQKNEHAVCKSIYCTSKSWL